MPRAMIWVLLMTLGFLFTATRAARAAFPDVRMSGERDVAAQERLRPRLNAIRREHPRMFFADPGLDDVRRRIETSEEVATVYGWLTEWVDEGHFYENLWRAGNQLIAAAVAYRLSEDAAALELAVRIADYLSDAEGDSWTYPRIAKGLAVGYDWLYDALTDEQKQRYAEAAIRNAKACYDTWRHSEFNNHLYLEYGPVLYVGIALYEEGIDDPTAERFALDGLDLLVNHMMPAHEMVNAGDGGWHESMSYHAFFTYEHALQIEAWQSATGEDLWTNFNGLDGEGAFQVYATRPHDRGWVGVADIGHRDSFSEANASYLVMTQRRRRDGLARYWTDYLKDEAQRRKDAGGRHVRVGSAWWTYVLYYDPSVPTVKPESLPTARLFEGVGWAAMRSDWTPSATHALFVCAPLWLGGHQHADNNSFVIHKNGLLALDSGVYDATAHRANYYARTIAHNTITVTDPNEQFNGGVWGSGRAGQGENDGGQRYTGGAYLVSDMSPGDEYHRGKIVAYEGARAFTYVVGDATRSYSASKLREFTRAFLFVPPDLFIVFDRVEATDAAFEKRWLLHAANEPQPFRSGVTVSNDESALYAQTVLPLKTERRFIGGPGREFEVNGTNYAPEKDYDPDEAGRWRVEIVPTEQVERQFFLHVLTVDDLEAAVSSIPDAAENLVGVRVQQSGRTVEASFAKGGDLTGTLEITAADGSVIVPSRALPVKVVR